MAKVHPKTDTWDVDERNLALGAKMRAARKQRDQSLGTMSYAIWEATRGDLRYDSSFLSRVETGKKTAPPDLLLIYGELLGATIEELPEFHLARARRQIEERDVGMKTALANLRRFEAAAAGPGALPEQDPAALQHGLEAPPSSAAGNRGSPKAASPRRRRSSKKRAS